MSCKAISAKKKLFFLFVDFRPLPNKNAQICDHFFTLLFPKDSKYLKNIGHSTAGSGSKKTFERYLKSEQTDTRTDGQTDKLTYRKHRPRGPMLWKYTRAVYFWKLETRNKKIIWKIHIELFQFLFVFTFQWQNESWYMELSVRFRRTNKEAY